MQHCMDEYILSFSDWESQKKEECARAYMFCKDILQSPLSEKEFERVWYSEHSDKQGKRHLANMCMSIFQSRKARAGQSFELAIAKQHADLGIHVYNQIYIDCDGNFTTKKPKTSCHKIDTLVPPDLECQDMSQMYVLSKKTTLRERYRQDLDLVGKCKAVIFLTKEIPEQKKIDTIVGYRCILVYPNASDSEYVWSYEKYFSEIKKFQEIPCNLSS